MTNKEDHILFSTPSFILIGSEINRKILVFWKLLFCFSEVGTFRNKLVFRIIVFYKHLIEHLPRFVPDASMSKVGSPC